MRQLLRLLLTLLERWLGNSIKPAQIQALLQKNAHLVPARTHSPSSKVDSLLDISDFGFLQTDQAFSSAMNLCEFKPEALADTMENLLRHIEVRRQGCLRKRGSRRAELWRSRHRAALLLSEFALRVKDLRFLSAALKLNDWAFPRYRRGASVKTFPLFLAALQSQEAALRELLP